jgi:hypothetical protein
MFPLVMVLAVSCSSPEQLFVFKVPLECGVSSSLGCGTKARPILDTLRTVEGIRWAALNRAGTRLAVRAPKNAEDRILSALAAKGIAVTKIADENDVKSLAATITDSTEWYSADHVNQLSRIEAEMIADQLVTPLVTMNLVDQSNRANLEAEIVEFLYDELTNRSYADIRSKQGNERWAEGIQAIGEKYVGKGNMPRMEMRYGRR